jgi:branched-chain amino acid transport system permease protein
MFSEQLIGNLIHGLVLGSIYGVATMGLSMIFGVLQVVNVGHGAFIMVGAFTSLTLFTTFGLNPFFALPLALAIGMALGYLFYYLIMQRLIKAPELASLLATFSIGIILEETVKLTFGSEFRGFNWVVGKLYASIGSVAVAALLYLWYHRTRSGTAVRSVIEDSVGARVCGINVNSAYALSFALGIGLTVMSGVLLTMFIPVGINPYMGGGYTLKAFVIAVLGGLGSPYGAFFGGLIFGLMENGSYTIFATIEGVEPFAMTRCFSFLVLLIILLIRPTGLFKSQ